MMQNGTETIKALLSLLKKAIDPNIEVGNIQVLKNAHDEIITQEEHNGLPNMVIHMFISGDNLSVEVRDSYYKYDLINYTASPEPMKPIGFN